MIKRNSLSFILLLFWGSVCFSQTTTVIKKQISWRYERVSLKQGTPPVSLITSDQIRLNAKGLPIILFDQQQNLTGNAQIELVNIKTQVVDPLLLSPTIQLQLTAEFTANLATYTQNKKTILSVSVVGLRKNSNHEIEALTSFEAVITTNTPALNKTIGSTTFKANSVLEKGTIYKLAVTNNGIYKIDYNYLKGLGYDMNAIDPRKIHIYGKGGGMLPRANNAYREDDLPENSIYVTGEADGKFDAQDYVAFYGKAQTTWNFGNGKYTHTSNYYDETTYYFLKIDDTPGKRIVLKPDPAGNPNKTVNSGDEYFVHELNKVNDYQSGAELLGESFGKNSSQNFSFSIPNIITSEDVLFRSSEVAHSVSATTTFTISCNGVPITSRNCNTVEESFDRPYYSEVEPKEVSFKATSKDFNIGYFFNKNGNNDARGWLDYFELVARKNLVMNGTQLVIRDSRSVGSGNISAFNIISSQPLAVWEVTDALNPKLLNTSFNASSSIVTFNIATDSLREFVCFTDASSSFPAPENKGKVANQNLHASSFADLIIVTHPDFLSQAERLATHRRQHDGLRVLVTTPQLIYNEFSSGAQDITAIRELVRMLYNKASTAADEPKYLLLFGDASFNYKETRVFIEADNRFYDNTNYVPTFESDNYYDTDSYASDDYYGMLDDNEGLWLPASFEAMDIGIGRLPVGNATQAEEMVDKILRYESPEALGDWRNSLMFIADDQDYNSHLKESELVSNIVTNKQPAFNISKIYLDSYKQISLGSGYSYPDATNAVNRGMQKGTLALNYTGHGSSIQLAHESLLTAGRDIVNWKNKYQLPLFFTATCEFTEFDHIAKVSAGEDVILNPDGGGIALLTTTRVAFSNVNSDLNVNFNSDNAFDKNAGGGNRLGDIMKATKNKNGVNSNPSAKHFILLGDPSLRLAVPRYNVITSKINNKPVTGANDTLKALQKVTLEGFVTNLQGDTMKDFNGEISITVYDKPGNYVTLANDADSYKQPFSIQKNFIFKGISAVLNGAFKIDMVIPKDIAYNFGKGKISYYAYDKLKNIDGAGSYNNIIIGGSDNTAGTDTHKPVVNLFINDTTFMNGGITHKNPVLLVRAFDENGINTSGVSVGHEMTAILDGDIANPEILNDFYEGVLNDFQRGTINFPYYNLAKGEHTIEVKVWDIYNNSGTGSIDFLVIDKEDLKIDKLMCYPNPILYGGKTRFSFEHNKPGESMDVTFQIYNSYGQQVAMMRIPETNGSARFDELEWTCENERGGELASGTYIIRATVKDQKGNTVNASSRFLILR